MMKHTLILPALLIASLLAPVMPTKAQTPAEKQVSDDLIRAGLSFMSYTQVTDSDGPLVLAATLLDAGLDLNPGNGQAWAMRAELAATAGDMEAYEAALAAYLNTGVKDERAQFNLIQYRLGKNSETLDGQLRALEELLNSEAGRALSGPLRSRLSMLASSLGAELLDTKAERRWLVDAARNDPGNAQAAQAMLSLLKELGGDNVRVGTATVNLIRADPLAPGARMELAAILSQEAAFERAAQQYMVVATRLSKQPLPMAAYLNWAQCLAMTGQDALALQVIEQLEAAINGRVPQTEDENEEENEEAADVPAPAGVEEDAEAPEAQPVELPIQFEVIRLAVLDGEDDSAAAQTVFDRIAETIKKSLAKQDGEGDGDGESKTDPAAELALIAAVFAPDPDQAMQLAQALADDQPEKVAAKGWLALRAGDRDAAEKLLGPLAGKHKVADAGLALLRGVDDAGRARMLSTLIQQASGSMASLVAGRQLIALEQTPTATAAGGTLTDLMRKSPESFWLVDVERTPWLEVRLKINPQRIMPLEPIRAEVTVWNTTRFPLAIGEGAPINQQAMVIINATSSGLPMAQSGPIVVDLGRRFTLGPGDRMVFETRLDYQRFGMMRATNAGLPLVFDARLVVNPTPTPGGNWLPNGIGGVSEVRNCLIQSTPAKEENIDQWLAAINAGDTTKRLEALGRLASLSKKTQPDLVGPALLDRIRNPLIDVWQKGTAAERAWLILNGKEMEKESTSYPELFGLATKGDEKIVWLALLARQVGSAESSVLRTAVGRQDLPEVSRFAETQRRLLREYETFVVEQERLRDEQQRLRQPGIPGFDDPLQPNVPQ